VDVIKIAIESSVPSEGERVMSLDTAKAIGETAHEQGKSIVAHITIEQDLLVAIEAGVDQIVHTGWGSRESDTLQIMVDRDII